MFSSEIIKFKRILIFAKLIEDYCKTNKIIENIRIAKDLANVLDELNKSRIKLSELKLETDQFFPEHWKRRLQLLQTAAKYCAEHSEELTIEDTPELETTFELPPSTCSIDMQGLIDKVSITSCENIYDEIDLIIRLISQHIDEYISIVSPTRHFTRYIAMRLTVENIDYVSNYGNDDISLEYIELIHEHFPNNSKSEIKQIAHELADIIVKNNNVSNSKVSILHPNEIGKIRKNGIVIYSELNETSWKQQDAGHFWLHRALREKIGLNSKNNCCEELFYYGISSSKVAHLIWAAKSEGQNSKKSHLLAKFEAIAEKSQLQLKTIPLPEEPVSTVTQQSLPHFKIRRCLDVRDVELLISNPEKFYITKILGLTPPIKDKKAYEIRKHFKNIAKSFFANKPVEDLLNNIKELDFFAYHKARQLYSWLADKFKHIPEYICDAYGELFIPEISFSLAGKADLIILAPEARVVGLQFSQSQLSKKILYEGSASLLSLCIIAENHGFANINKPIRNIQLINLFSPEKEQFIYKEIELSADVIETGRQRLIENLSEYLK